MLCSGGKLQRSVAPVLDLFHSLQIEICIEKILDLYQLVGWPLLLGWRPVLLVARTLLVTRALLLVTSSS